MNIEKPVRSLELRGFKVSRFATGKEAADYLAREGVDVRGGLHCAPGAHRFLGTLERGAVRASVGHETTFEDVEALLRAVKKMLREN